MGMSLFSPALGTVRSVFQLIVVVTLIAGVPTAAASFGAHLITNERFENQTGLTGSGYDYSNTPTGWAANAAWDANASNAVAGYVYGVTHSGIDSVRFGETNNSSSAVLSQAFADVPLIVSLTLYRGSAKVSEFFTFTKMVHPQVIDSVHSSQLAWSLQNSF